MIAKPIPDRWIPAAVFLAGLVATALVASLYSRAVATRNQLQFQNQVQAFENHIIDHLGTTSALLRGAAGMFAARPATTRDEFAVFVERLKLEQNYPGIQGIGWSQRLVPGEEERVVRAARESGIADFHIWPSEPPREYHSIVFLEPLDRRNRAALGYDMFSERTRRAAMERARDEGVAAMSAKVTLVQEIEGRRQAGFLIYLPVYEGGSIPFSIEQRRARLLGFVYAPIRAGDFLDMAFKMIEPIEVTAEAYDGGEVRDESLLHRYPDQPSPSPAFRLERTLSVAGRPWTLVFTSRPEFERRVGSDFVALVVLGGVLLSFSLSGIIRTQVQARRRADEAAQRLRLSQQELERSQDRLHLALAAAHMTVWERDVASDTMRESEEMGPLFGRAPGWSHGDWQALLADLHPEDRERVDATLAAALAGCAEFETEFRVLWPDGSTHWLGVRGQVLRGKQAGSPTVVGVFFDIQARKHAEEVLQEVARAKDVFLAMLAHELRNPLATIGNALHVMKLEGGLTEPTARLREMAERQLGHLVRLVDDMLDVSRMTQGKIRLVKSDVELSRVVNDAVEAARPSITAGGLHLSVKLSPEPLVLHADAVRITQVIANLLSNAAKYTPNGGHIWLVTEREDGRAVVRVRDDGAGIAPELLPHIFELFTQGEEASGGAKSGMGIGLTLVEALVEMHGGTVEARSGGLGMGSEFTVKLPCQAALPAAEEARPRAEAPSPSARSRRVLVVDDNADSAESVGMLVEMLGHEVQLAHDGPSALERAATRHPEIVLLDIGLPGMSGYEVAQRMRKLVPAAVLAAMTGWGGEEDRRRSKEAGFHHHLLKPVDIDALVALLSGAMAEK